MKLPLIIAGIFAAPVGLYLAIGPLDGLGTGPGTSFVVPSLSPEASLGKDAFIDACGDCHGAYGEGTDIGPPLLHPLYGPMNLPDERIREVIHQGALAQRWPFGDMPAIRDMDAETVEHIVGFLREMQAANEIE